MIKCRCAGVLAACFLIAASGLYYRSRLDAISGASRLKLRRGDPALAGAGDHDPFIHTQFLPIDGIIKLSDSSGQSPAPFRDGSPARQGARAEW